MAIDTTAMRESWAGQPGQKQIYALCDELDAARGEVERLKQLERPLALQREHARAERAEAEAKDWRVGKEMAIRHRDEARARVATLREALERQLQWFGSLELREDKDRENSRTALASTAQAAAEHDARVRDAAIEECADYVRRCDSLTTADAFADALGDILDDEPGGVLAWNEPKVKP